MSALDLAATVRESPEMWKLRRIAGETQGRRHELTVTDAVELLRRIAALEGQAADAQAASTQTAKAWFGECRAAEARAVRAEEALRQTRPLVVEVRDNQQWTPMSGARREWAVAMLAKIDSALADAGADTPLRTPQIGAGERARGEARAPFAAGADTEPDA